MKSFLGCQEPKGTALFATATGVKQMKALQLKVFCLSVTYLTRI